MESMMTSPQMLPTRLPAVGSVETPARFKAFAPQLGEAERELGAFVAAVDGLFGRAAADCAAECWVELAERTDLPLADGCATWRHITIMAASRLAAGRSISGQ